MMDELQLGDLSVEIQDEGSGEAVILVHGSASDRRTWTAQREGLAERFRVVSYSRRYHWPNPPGSDDAHYSMSQQVSDLVALIEALDAGPTRLVGHSYGGFVALILSLRHPELVRSQVLIEPPVVPLFLSDPPKPTEVVRVLATRPRLGFALLKFGATGLVPATKAAKKNDMETAVQLFGKAVLGKTAFSQLSESRWEQVKANNIRAEYLSESFDPLTADQVRSIQTPTLLVSGADSPNLWGHLADYLHELLPNSSRLVIRAASHIVHEDNPEVFNRDALAFLSAAE